MKSRSGIKPCICKHCGNEYIPKERVRDKYCSRECFFADIKTEPKIKVNPVCIICNKEFTGQVNARFCSDKCYKVYEHNKYIEHKRTEAYVNSLYKQRNKYTPKMLKILTCKTCGKTFISKRDNALYCNEKCSPSYVMHRGQISRAKRIRVYKRDNYTCKLCGKPLDMGKIDTFYSNNPHPLAPTIDHIIPVSTAKELHWTNAMIHSESNLQAAHFICNIRRGNKPIIEITETTGR